MGGGVGGEVHCGDGAIDETGVMEFDPRHEVWPGLAVVHHRDEIFALSRHTLTFEL